LVRDVETLTTTGLVAGKLTGGGAGDCGVGDGVMLNSLTAIVSFGAVGARPAAAAPRFAPVSDRSPIASASSLCLSLGNIIGCQSKPTT